MTYLVDANVLVYSTNRGFSAHATAYDWLSAKLAGPVRTAALPWPSVLTFLRVTTNPRLFRSPLTSADSWRRVEHWMAAPAAWVPVPGPNHQAILGEIVAQVSATGNLTADAHLAALARENGLTVASADSDFAKFPGLKWINPLAGD